MTRHKPSSLQFPSVKILHAYLKDQEWDSRKAAHSLRNGNDKATGKLSWNANMYRAESLVSFLRKDDVITIGPKQKGNILYVVQQTKSSTLGVYDIRSPIASYMY